MTQRNFLRLMVLASCILILTVAAFNPSAHAAYNFTTVNVPGSDGTKAQDINDAGMVVGYYMSGGTTWYGFTFDGTTYSSYEMPGSDSTRFTGINDNGDITGEYSGGATDWTGFKYDGSTWASLSVPNAARTDPRGINDSGHIAGWNRGPLYCAGYGFFYDGLTFTTIEYPGTDESACLGGPGPLDATRVFDINDSGKIVGFYVIDNALHGFTYEGGTYNTFDYPGPQESYAIGINDLGHIVGAYNDNSTWKTYLYENGTWSELFIAGSTYTIATGINNNGVITGYYNDGTKEYGFIATPANPSSPKIKLPQTGQTTSYLSGDDGDIMAGVAWPATGNSPSSRFNCDADTCTDLLTGLTWLRDANCIASQYPGDDTEDTAGDGKVSWFTGRNFIINVNNGSRPNCAAGENDWRMPNINELHSLLNYGAADMAGWLSSEGFQNVQSDNYWVSTAYAIFTNNGWAVRIASNSFDIIFENQGQWGGSRGGHTSLPNWDRDLYPPDCYDCSFPYVWLVRGGPDDNPDAAYPANLPETGQKTSGYSGDDGDLEWGVSAPTSGNSTSGRFTDNGNDTMTDLLTGLMWTKSGNVAYPEKIKSFQGAMDYIADMNDGTNLSGLCATPCANFGSTDWKLPNVVELRSLLNFEFECQGLPSDAGCNKSPFYGGGAIGTYLNWEGFTQITDATSEPRITTAGYWSSTTDASNTNRAYTVAFGFQGGVVGTFDKTSTCVTTGVYPCPSWGPNPSGWFLWPVRTAPAYLLEPDISVTPSSYDFGDVMQGTDSDVTFTINNIGDSDLSIIHIAQSNTIDPPFSLVSGQDNCSGTIVAPAAGCTFDVRFSPVVRGGYNDIFDILSNDPDTSTVFVSVSGTGTTAYLTELPKTGQTISYDAGDDGDIMAGVAWPTSGNMGSGRFNDNNSDGTVTDLLTGLMWTKNANNGPVNFFSARDAAAALTTGGYNDWRIPNLLELESLTHAGQADTAAWLNLEGFTGVQAASYWVSSIYVDAGNGGWSLNLGTDQTGYWHTWSTDLMHYWAVRGGANGAPDPTYPANVRKTGRTIAVTTGDDGDLEWGVAPPATRFSNNLDGTMTDDLTGLMWTQSASPFSTIGSHGAIHSFADAMGFIDAINAGDSVCRVDPAQRKQCFPWSGRPVIPQTLCPADYSCIGAGLNPDTYGECYGPGLTYCNDAADCNAAENEECTQLDNYNYNDWRMANKKEMYSLVHMDSDGTVNDEFATDELAAAGFIVPNFAWCSHWTSTADPADPMNKVYGVSLNTGGFQMLTHSLVDASAPFGCNWSYVPQFVWPVRTAPAPSPEPDISVTPSSYDFGNVAVGVTSNTVFTVENLGSGGLDITSVTIPSSDFSVQSEDCTTLSPLAQNDTCSISVDFTPSAESAMAEDLSVISNDPDTPVLTAGLSGTGIPAVIDLELNKTVNNPSPVVGSTITFTVAITNNGPADATGVSVEDVLPNGYSNIQNISNGGTETAGTITWSGLNLISGSTINLTFDADVNASGNYLNVAQVTAADQPDNDSTPNNDDGDQTEDDEDNTIIVLPGSSYTLLSQPRTNPGDPYPCNLWAGAPGQWCDPTTWPAGTVYAAPWDDADIPGGSIQILAENFILGSETTITNIKVLGGYWSQDIAPTLDNFTIIFHNDAGGSIGTVVASPGFTTSRDDAGATWVDMKWTATNTANALVFEYTFTLTDTLTLPPGTYWIEMYNDTTGHTANNDFFWAWGYLDNVNGIDGLAWTTASAPGSNWGYDSDGNLAIEINGQAAGTGCNLRAKNLATSTEYCTIQEAYNEAGNNDTIHVKDDETKPFTETLNFNIDKLVTINGGYDNNYSTVIGNTTLNGNVTSNNGSVTMGNFILQ